MNTKLELCPADANESHSDFLDVEITGVNLRMLERLENGERADFKRKRWGEKLIYTQKHLNRALEMERAALAAGNGSVSRIQFVENQLAYAVSLNIATSLAGSVHQVASVGGEEYIHLPLSAQDEMSRKVGIYLLSHTCELSREADDSPVRPAQTWSYEAAEAAFSSLLTNLEPGREYPVAKIGDVQVTALPVFGPPLVEQQDRILNGLNLRLGQMAILPMETAAPIAETV